jgi:hypothetical protein
MTGGNSFAIGSEDYLFAWFCEKDAENTVIGNSAHNDYSQGSSRRMTRALQKNSEAADAAP